MAARLMIWPAMAYMSDNKAMLITEIVSCGIHARSIYKHDIKGASGIIDAPLTMDLAAYLHGIIHNSATGASIDGQVDTSAGRNDLEEQYAYKVKTKPNPRFITQEKLAAEL